jgi:hypothetical protein
MRAFALHRFLVWLPGHNYAVGAVHSVLVNACHRWDPGRPDLLVHPPTGGGVCRAMRAVVGSVVESVRSPEGSGESWTSRDLSIGWEVTWTRTAR